MLPNAFFMSLERLPAINWLPTSLNAWLHCGAGRHDHFDIGVGGVIGTYTLGLQMDRLGPHAMLMLAFLLAVIGFYLFATVSGMAEWSTTLLLMATGFGVIGAQVGITTLTSMIYPVAMRSTGLGWALGVGRVGSIVGPAIGGLMLATIADPRSVYLACTVPALIGALAIALLRWRASPPPRPVLVV